MKVYDTTKRIILFCIKWRFLIALVAFIIGVALKLHSSSINEYNYMFSNSDEYVSESIILGESRAIRSDEWLVNTPYYMSQSYNDFNKESYAMSLSGQNMLIGPGSPILDVTIIAKPFLWGYILLGNEYGLSWYWCARIITLLLVSFEFCLILTKKDKKVSLIGMLMLTFAPSMQWWSIIDIYVWGMMLLVLGYYFFTGDKKRKNLCSVLAPIAVTAFVSILYPALQWPTGLFMVALLIGLLVRDKKDFCFEKIDIFRIVAIVAVVLVVLVYMIIGSREAMVIMAGTSYPGAVVALGGNGAIQELFTDLTTFTLPFKNITYSNNSEISTFIHFTPLFLMAYPIIYKKRKRDREIIVGNFILTCLIIMAAFMLIGFPELLAKLTLFSYITRMKLTYGLAATVFTIWGIHMIWKKQILSNKNIMALLLIYTFCYICFVGEKELSYLNWWHYGIIIGGLVALLFTLLKGYKKTFMIGMATLMMVSGATINPIARGIGALIDHPLEKKIAEIAENNPDAYWITNGDIRLASVATANGARVLNIVNVYPDFEKWEKLDPEEIDKDIYNRYAHIIINLTDKETKINLGATKDVIALSLSCEDSIKWPTEYLISSGEIEYCKSYYDQLYEDSESNYYIYERRQNVK